MDIKSLKKKKAEIEASFETFKTERETYTNKIAEVDVELVKLQGEYRLVQDLIDQNTNKEKK